jgi:hypothetical protein
MTENSTINRNAWRGQLDGLTADHEGQDVTIEVVDQEYGDQHEAERLPFRYASYDPKDDVVIIAIGGRSSRYPVVLRHMVWHPTEVDVDTQVNAVRVVEPDGTTTIMTFFPAEQSDRS